MQTSHWIELIGGLAFFFYGLQAIRSALQLMAGGRIKAALGKVTNNRFVALGFGMLITLILQSSSATTVMLVSLASTQLLTLTQAFGVILGADIGTTFVVILLSIKIISDYALLIVAMGFGIQWVAKRYKTKHIGAVILGFGLVFFGLHVMADATSPLKESALATNIFEYLASHPFANLIAATIFTSIVQASAATIGMAISLSFAGLISFEAAIPIVLGANVGTCITAFLGCIGMGIDGKRVAVAHVLVKIIGVIIAFPFIGKIAAIVNQLSWYITAIIPTIEPGDASKIAITHLLFNVAIALLFLPLVKWGVAFVKGLVPEPMHAEKPFGPIYLDDKVLDTPVLACAQARREIVRTSEIAFDLFRDCLKIFERGGDTRDRIDDIESRDDKIDILEKAIRFYLAKLSREQLNDEMAKFQSDLVTIAGNIEEIGDIISKELVPLAKKKWNNNLIFSEDGWKELRHFHSLVVENFNLTISAITSPYTEVIQKILKNQQVIYSLEGEYQQAHLNRLHEGMRKTFETSSIHLDVLSNLRRVNGQLTYIAKLILEENQMES